MQTPFWKGVDLTCKLTSWLLIDQCLLWRQLLYWVWDVFLQWNTWAWYLIAVVCVLLQLISSVGEWGIDIFQLSELANGRPLTVIGYTLFKVEWICFLCIYHNAYLVLFVFLLRGSVCISFTSHSRIFGYYFFLWRDRRVLLILWLKIWANDFLYMINIICNIHSEP